MNILYASVQCSIKKFNQVFGNSKIFPAQQAQKYNRLLVEGFADNGSTRVYAVTAVPVTEKNCAIRSMPYEVVRQGNIKYHYLPFLNIHRVHDMVTLIESFVVSFWLLRSRKMDAVIFDVLNVPVALGAMAAAKICGIMCTGIITDVPDVLFKSGDRIYHLGSNFLIHHSDSYVLLTEQMNEIIKNQYKPYVIVEGIVDDRMPEQYQNMMVSNKKIVMYCGSIQKKYGIGNLIDAFIKADIENSELHIYGNGDYVKELQKKCAECDRIKYFGEISNQEMVKAELGAALLINPRPSGEEFTKYSFPSKNMEYMLSGIPVLTTMLPGMPEEYRSYVYIIEDDTAEGIAVALKSVLSKSNDELLEMGNRARNFVMHKKNKRIQAGRVIAMLNQVGDKI